MNSPSLHLVWHIHQPFFIPEDEVRWRFDSSYIPLIDALSERKIPCSINITGSTLRGASKLCPEFVDILRDYLGTTRSVLLGSAAYHPILPWLTTKSALAQIRLDRNVKQGLGFSTGDIFWPTELAWSTRVGILAAAEGYKFVVIDSASRDFANQLPQWKEGERGLLPFSKGTRKLGVSSQIRVRVPSSGDSKPIVLVVREHSLSKAFLEYLSSDQRDLNTELGPFLEEMEKVRIRFLNPRSPLVLAEDVERFLPNSLPRFLDFLDELIGHGVSFLSFTDFNLSAPIIEHKYVPASTMEGDESIWMASVDDMWFRAYAAELSTSVESLFDITNVSSEIESTIVETLLRIQDSSFYFWHYISRARAPFYREARVLEELIKKYQNGERKSLRPTA